jgi:hypothetical protein
MLYRDIGLVVDSTHRLVCGIFLSSTYKTMDKVQNKPNSSVQHTPSSESFQVYVHVVSLLVMNISVRNESYVKDLNVSQYQRLI